MPEEQANIQDPFTGFRASPAGPPTGGRGLSLSQSPNRPSSRDSFGRGLPGMNARFEEPRRASNESTALSDALQIVKDSSAELRELRGELRDLERSRAELDWTTTELQSTKEEVDDLKRERAELRESLREKDELTKRLTSDLRQKESSLSSIVALLESMKREVEDLKKNQAEIAQGEAREMRQVQDRLRQLTLNSSKNGGKSIVDLKVYLGGRMPGVDADYRVMERAVFDIDQAGLVWLTSRPTWHFDGLQVSYSRFTAIIEEEKVALDGLRDAIVRSHARIWKCDVVSNLKL